MSLKKRISGSLPTLGVLINQIDGRYQSVIYRSMSDYARENSIRLLFFVGRASNSPYVGEEEYNRIYDLAKSRRIDGLIVVSGSLGNYIGPEGILDYLKEFPQIPKVSLSFKLDGIPSVLIDNYAGMRELINHLVLHHRYRKLVFIRGPKENPEAEDRFRAYKDSLEEFGILFKDELVFQGDFSFRYGYNFAKTTLKKLQDFDVIVSSNDEMAIGLISGLEKNSDLLNKIHVTGFDDIIESRDITPSLTTIRCPIYEQAYIACSMINDMINGKEVEKEVYLKGKLIIRESCGCFEIDGHKFSHLFSSPEENFSNKKVLIDRDFLLKIITSNVDIKQSEFSLFFYLLENLLDAFSFDLSNKPEKDYFSRDLNFSLEKSIHFQYFGEIWRTTLLILKEYVNNYLNDEINFANELIQKGEQIVSRWIEKKEFLYSQELFGLLYNLRHTVKRINSVFYEKNLMDVILDELKILNIEEFYLCLYNNLSSKVFISLPYRNKLIKDLEGFEINKEDILPDIILDEKRKVYILMSLCNRDKQFGYVVFGDLNMQPMVFEFLREQISSAIFSVRLFEEREKTSEELQRILEEVKKSEQKFKEMALLLPTIIIDIDLNGKISFINQAGLEFLETNEKDLGNILQYVQDKDRDRFRKDIFSVLDKKEGLSFYEYTFISKRGVEKPIIAKMISTGKEKNEVRINAFNLELLRSSFIMPKEDFFEKFNITDREKEIILLMLQSYRIKDIAARLFIAESTVKGHITQIYSKVGVNNKSELLEVLEKYKVGYSDYYSYLLSKLDRS